MQIHLYSGDRLLAQLDNDDAQIGAYPIENGMRLHVIDQNPITLNEQVEKFELSDREYSQRRNTVRDYLKSNKLGKYNAEEMAALEAQRAEEAREQEALASKIELGNRCLVTSKGPRRIGTVMYKGPLDGKPGIFIGVKFDEPLGMHDGRWVGQKAGQVSGIEDMLMLYVFFFVPFHSVNGKRYFECLPKYGSMVPVGAVEIGEFPPETDFSDEEL